MMTSRGKSYTINDRKIAARQLYGPHCDQIVFRLALLGLTYAKIAKFFGISSKEFIFWCQKYPSFRQAYMEGGVNADAKVAEALYQKAIGYEKKEEKVVLNSQTGEFTTVEVTEKLPPETAAIKLWLSNRQKELWRLQPEDEAKGGTSVTVNVVNFSDGTVGVQRPLEIPKQTLDVTNVLNSPDQMKVLELEAEGIEVQSSSVMVTVPDLEVSASFASKEEDGK